VVTPLVLQEVQEEEVVLLQEKALVILRL